MISGKANADATKQYADNIWKKNPKISPNSWKIVEGNTVSKIGFGSYRVTTDTLHENALRKALLSGINLIDTSSNYTDGQSESLIGKMLTALVDNNEITREQVVVISKGGYIQGASLRHAQTNTPEGVVKLNEHLWYSIHPENLKLQLTKSLERLNLESLDGYLLHNPEYILGHKAAINGDLTEQDKEEFYAQIEQAFTFLEEQVKEGVISFYGVSSNTFGAAEDQPDHISLSKTFEIASKAAQKAWGRKKRSAFRCVQMPINLMELGALHTENNTAKTFDGDEHVSVLELASRMNLTVLANRPLNAFPLTGGTYRLADASTEISEESINTLVENLCQSEDALNKILEGWPQVSGQPLFSFTNQGEELLQHMTGSIQYDHLCSTFIYPHIGAFNHALEEIANTTPAKAESIELTKQAYNKALAQLILALREYVRTKDEEAIRPIELELRDRVPEKWKSAKMQQLALNAIASLPGVSCVLCGMRKEDYIDDALYTMELGDFVDPAKVIGSTH